MSAELYRLPTNNPAGEVDLYPACEEGGVWAVDHISRRSDRGVRVGTWLRLDDAVAAAKQYAARTGADFVEAWGRI